MVDQVTPWSQIATERVVSLGIWKRLDPSSTRPTTLVCHSDEEDLFNRPDVSGPL